MHKHGRHLQEADAEAPVDAPAAGAGRLTPDEFAARYIASWRVFWCVAVGVCADATEAEDVLQEAAIIGLEKLDTFRGDGFIPWISSVVRFVALNHGRKRARRREVALGDASPEAWADDGAPNAAPRDGSLRAAVEALPEPARTCLLLRALFDMPYREIAARLDIPEGTAMSHVHRARRRLRASLDQPEERHREGRAR